MRVQFTEGSSYKTLKDVPRGFVVKISESYFLVGQHLRGRGGEVELIRLSDGEVRHVPDDLSHSGVYEGTVSLKLRV